MDLGINADAMEEVLNCICSVGVQEIVPAKEAPEEGCDNYEALKAAVDAENEANKAKNEALAKLQAKIGFQYMEVLPAEEAPEPVQDAEGGEGAPEEGAEPPAAPTRPRDPNDWAFWREKCYVRVGQYRDLNGPPVEEPPKDKKAQLAAQQKAAEEAKKAAEKAAAAEAGLPEEEPPFEIEKIPAKAPMLQALNRAQDVNMMLHHTGKYCKPRA